MKKNYVIGLPQGTIYGDTGNIEKELKNLEMTDCIDKNDFIEELVSLNKFRDLSKFEKFIYQDTKNLFEITYEELKQYLD